MDNATPRIVFVTGGVSSSLGKGIAAASLARLLSARGLSVRSLKMDPYLSVDAGTLAPAEHGECWVTPDGAETDLDLGHYYRFGEAEPTGDACVTSGRVYADVLAAERRGDYLGRTVQVVPHVTNEIRRRILRAGGWEEGVGGARLDGDDRPGPVADVLIAEVGGTVGDIEILPFLETIRQLRAELPPGAVCSLHLTLLPAVGPGRELKTKPSQHSVATLRSYGINPDILMVRSSEPVPDSVRTKLCNTCGVHPSRIVVGLDAPSVYAVPASLAAEGLDRAVVEVTGLTGGPLDLSSWEAAVAPLVDPPQQSVRIGVVGKYLDGHDAYLSVVEALRHAGADAGVAVTIEWVAADDVAAGRVDLGELDAVVVPGGFGARAVEGKIAAAGASRRAGIPYLGLCLGLQVAVVEFARSVAGLEGATSAEWGEPGPQVIALMESQVGVVDKGATMRLGNWPAVLAPDTLTARLYGARPGERLTVGERHRHRYEVNPALLAELTGRGLVVAGRSPDGRLVEHIELPGHPFFCATQAHPELQSRPGAPHPLFKGLVAAAVERADRLRTRV